MKIISLENFSEKLRTIINAKYKKNTDFYRAFDKKYGFSIEKACKQWLKATNYPKNDTLIYLCDFLDCDFEYFLTEQQEFKRTDKTITDLLGISSNSIKTLEKLDAEQIDILNYIMNDYFTFNIFLSNIKNYISGDFDTPIYFERLEDNKSISPPKIGVDIIQESPITPDWRKKEKNIYIQNSSSKDKGFIAIPVSMTKTYFLDCIRDNLEDWKKEYERK